MRTAGIVLCGGMSTRMGQPKAWLPFGGEPLLVRIVNILAAAAGPVVVVAAQGQDLPPLPPGATIVQDETPQLGPLGGLAAGLATLVGMADAVYLSSCDVPLLKVPFVKRVLGCLTDGVDIAVPEAEGFKHPLAAAYRVRVLPFVQQLVTERRLRPVFLFDLVNTKVLTPDIWADVDAENDSLKNANTPEEFDAIVRRKG